MDNRRRVHEMDLAMLCHQFSLILKSGIHPVEGIPILVEDTQNLALKNALQDIASRCINGSSLYEAFSSSKCFPDYMVSMIKVGEQTGMLEAVMDSLSQFYENEADIKKKIRSSVSYPIVLAVMILGVIALISLKVIPMFVDMLSSLGGEIPSQVNVFMALGNAFQNGFLYIIILIAVLVLGFFVLRSIKPVRFWFDKLKITNPLTGNTYRKITASRFSGALALTLKNGMGMMEGFGVISGVLSNQYALQKTQEVATAITEGKEFSESLRKTRLFPELFVRLVKTGEKTGSLDLMMDKVSHIYKEEVDNSLKRIISYIEPICVTILSLILAGVLLSVILPLISIMSSIG